MGDRRSPDLVTAALGLALLALPACSARNHIQPGAYTASKPPAASVQLAIAADKREVTFTPPGAPALTRRAQAWDPSKWPMLCPRGLKDTSSEVLDSRTRALAARSDARPAPAARRQLSRQTHRGPAGAGRRRHADAARHRGVRAMQPAGSAPRAIGLRDPLTLANSLRFPLQSAASRRRHRHRRAVAPGADRRVADEHGAPNPRGAPHAPRSAAVARVARPARSAQARHVHLPRDGLLRLARRRARGARHLAPATPGDRRRLGALAARGDRHPRVHVPLLPRASIRGRFSIPSAR